MSLLIPLILGLFTCLHADETVVEITRTTPVYSQPAPGGPVRFTLRPGEKVQSGDAKAPEFVQIRVKRKGLSLSGYVLRTDLEGDELTLTPPEAPRRKWALGLGFEYLSLAQGGKSFETQDQVQYATSAYTAKSLAPELMLQISDPEFWRLTLASKKLHYTGTAVTNVAGAQTQDVDLKYSFYSALLQKAWTPFATPLFYLGVGAELAKATSVDLKLSGTALATSSADMPLYLGALAFAGSQLSLGSSFSFFAEARYEYIANQTPSISGLEGALGLLWWL